MAPPSPVAPLIELIASSSGYKVHCRSPPTPATVPAPPAHSALLLQSDLDGHRMLALCVNPGARIITE